jgi:SAM-dependent methyltransferase
MNQTKVLSPITGKPNCKKLKSYAVKNIQDNYLADFGIQTNHYFKGNSTIELWECLDTGLSFFFPSNLEGDSAFYAQLEKFDWYYLPWKWEHEYIAPRIPNKGNLLEIGCAEGAFLEKMKQKGLTVVGLELNEEAAKIANTKGLEVHTQLIQEYAATHAESQDWVCSFQVLEHISSVAEFLTAALQIVKPGGKLAISVPNLQSFLKYDEGGLLNFPPHHQGWWNASVFKALENYFPVKLDFVGFEPVQDIHESWYRKNAIRKWYQKGKILGGLYSRIIKLPVIGKLIYKAEKSNTAGHTMLVLFTKTVS